ncbi:MAG: hypothetical protein ABJG15_07260 [Hyphomonadaceae bacterium]
MHHLMAKASLIATTALFSTLFDAPACGQTSAENDQTDQRILDEVETNQKLFDPDAPTTGNLLVRPLLTANREAEVEITGYELVFTPVEIAEDGSAIPYGDGSIDRIHLKGVIPIAQERGRIRRNVQLSGYPVMSVTLPGGTYTLSEVHYSFIEVLRSNRLAGNGDNISIPDSRPERTSYCLSGRSLVFDVANGETSYLGSIALADLPSNPLRNSDHRPIFGIDQNTSLAGLSLDKEAELKTVDLADTSFDPESGICASTRFNVEGWTPKG